MYNLRELEKDQEIFSDIAKTSSIVAGVARPEIRSLTGFRFITAFMIYVFHCSFHFGSTFPIHLVDRIIRNGAVFMTGFFVLSGFIMSYVYEKVDFSQRKNILTFYVKRIARIYPAYITGTIVYLAVFSHFHFKEYARSIVDDIFLVQGFFPSMFLVGINGGTWSLTVEMFLYFLFPFISLLSRKPSTLLLVAVILSSVSGINALIDPSDYYYTSPLCRISDFLFGIGIYHARHRFNLNYWQHGLVILALCVATFFLGLEKYMYVEAQVLIAALFAVWIAAVYHSKSLFYNNLVLEYLGKISYSFYMWQFLTIECGKKVISAHPSINPWMVVIAGFVMNVSVSTLSYHILEKKVRSLLSTFLMRKIEPVDRLQSVHIL
jgi:peptidoglycan/LPS O-acetylase OafA/YrhL